jgi:hypothetical protein
MRAQHHVMKIRGDINAVSEGPDGGHALLAAFLEATGKIDRRALHKRVALSEAPIAVNLEALPAPLEANPTLPEVDPALVEAALAALDAVPTLLEESPTAAEANPTLLEASPPSTAPKSEIARFAFRRANLVRA